MGAGSGAGLCGVRIAQVISGLGNEASGPTYSVVQLARGLGRLGNEVELYSIGDRELAPSPGTVHRVFPRARVAGPLYASPPLRRALLDGAGDTRIVHNHGLWAMANIYVTAAAREARAPLVVSPRGTLAPWALRHHRWRKRVLWLVGQRATCHSAKLFHATSEGELADIRAAGFDQPVAVIPNGIDIPEAATAPANEPGRTVLFLGRLHPVKGVDRLVEAWARVHRDFPDWRLRLVGPDELGTAAALRASAAVLQAARIEFSGAVFGADKDRAYREAELYVLPTHSENFGITVAESLARGVPAIVTKGAPWGGLAREHSGWWIDQGVEPLEAALREALAMPPEALRAMGARGRDWMRRDFGWDGIAAEMMAAYEWLLGRGERPGCVEVGR